MNEKSAAGMDIIYFFFEDDFEKWHRKFVVRSFVRVNPGWRVIGVKIISFWTAVTDWRCFLRHFFVSPVEKIEEGIWAIRFFTVFPVRILDRSKLLIKLLSWFLAFQLRLFLKEINKDEKRLSVFWAASLSRMPFCFAFEGQVLVYDCHDELILFDGGIRNSIQKNQEAMEQELLERADVFFANAKYLYDQKKERARNSFYIPQGIGEHFLGPSRSIPSPLCDIMAKIKKPIIGYVGNFRSWLDFDLLVKIAQDFPEASLVFVGNIEPDVEQEKLRFKTFPNVFFLGRQSYDVIPDIIREFNVGLIPFRNNQFNLSTAPYKFMEYMALGKPILSLNIFELRDYAQLIDLYETHEEAIAKLKNILEGRSDEELVLKRSEAAKSRMVNALSRRYYDALSGVISARERSS